MVSHTDLVNLVQLVRPQAAVTENKPKTIENEPKQTENDRKRTENKPKTIENGAANDRKQRGNDRKPGLPKGLSVRVDFKC